MIIGKHQKVGAIAFIKNKDRVLVARRSLLEDYAPEHWEIVGGAVEWGEEPEEGVRREIQEETGLIIPDVTLFHYYHDINLQKKMHLIMLAFTAETSEQEIVLSEEHTEYKWISEQELQDLQPMKDLMRAAIVRGFEVTKSA